LTSVEMVALCRVMAILFFKIVMPLQWFAGKTHFLGQFGFDWSVLSMGKALDALEASLIQMKDNWSFYLEEAFMNSTFSKIHTDDEGKEVLEPLEEAMSSLQTSC